MAKAQGPEREPREILLERLHARWPQPEQHVFLDTRYYERMERAARSSGLAHGLTQSGRFVIGAAALSPVLTAAGADALSGWQYWLKILGIAIGALVAVTTAMLTAVRASPTWLTYYDLRVELERIGWQAQGDPQYTWATFVTAVNDAVHDHSTRYATAVVDPSTVTPGT